MIAAQSAKPRPRSRRLRSGIVSTVSGRFDHAVEKLLEKGEQVRGAQDDAEGRGGGVADVKVVEARRTRLERPEKGEELPDETGQTGKTDRTEHHDEEEGGGHRHSRP